MEIGRKIVIGNHWSLTSMTMLAALFPGLEDSSQFTVPTWVDPEAPWSILGKGEKSLIEQIREIVGSDDGVFIHPEASIGEFVFIEGPCYIGAGVEIRHTAYIRKGSWICENAVVGHSTEIKNSLLLPGSKAPHFNYVGDSILGFEANLGAGTKLSNVRNDRRNIFARLGNGDYLDTGLWKMGALVGDGSQLGCNVVTNPGSILMPISMIAPNQTVSGWNES